MNRYHFRVTILSSEQGYTKDVSATDLLVALNRIKNGMLPMSQRRAAYIDDANGSMNPFAGGSYHVISHDQPFARVDLLGSERI